MTMTKLTGSKKQIEWGENIRRKFINRLEFLTEKLKQEDRDYLFEAKLGGFTLEDVPQWVEMLMHQNSANWWIENRTLLFKSLAMMGIELNMLMNHYKKTGRF